MPIQHSHQNYKNKIKWWYPIKICVLTGLTYAHFDNDSRVVVYQDYTLLLKKSSCNDWNSENL